MERRIYDIHFPRERKTPLQAGLQGKLRMDRRQKIGVRGKPSQSLSWGFCRKWGRVKSLGFTRLNKSSGLWAIQVVSSCLVPGPGMV